MLDDSTATAVAALAAKQEIRDVLHRYCTGVDRKDFDLMRSAYHDDAYDDHGAYRGPVDGLLDWVRRRHEDIDQSMHFLGNCTIELDGDRAYGETYCIVHQRGRDPDGDPVRFSIGCRYLDRFERRDGWRIAQRTVAFEWWREEPCALERTLPDGWTMSQRSRADALYRMKDEAAV